jgi:hypothetical protein
VTQLPKWARLSVEVWRAWRGSSIYDTAPELAFGLRGTAPRQAVDRVAKTLP